jgi:hypothetical protein
MTHVWAIEYLAGGTNYSRCNVEAQDFALAYLAATLEKRIEPVNLLAIWCVSSSMTPTELTSSLRGSMLSQATRIAEARKLLGQPEVRIGWFWKVLGKILRIF